MAVYFIAGLICGLALAWYRTKQYYDTRTISLEEHKRIIKELTHNNTSTGNAEDDKEY